MSYFTKHIESVEETYFQHFRHAASFVWWMFWAMCACFVHTVFPFFFEKTGSNIIAYLYDRMVINRANLTPKPTPKPTH